MNFHLRNWELRRRVFVAVFVWCSIILLMPFPTLGAEEAKSAYDKIKSLDAKHDAARDLEYATAEVTGDYSKIDLWGGPYVTERMRLQDELKALAASGDPEAEFYWGYHNWEEGLRAAASSGKMFQDLANNFFKEAHIGFRVASDAGFAPASWNIAVMYEQGNGVTRSKLAAAEWYSKAGHQYLKAGEREKALAALERIEEVDKKHPYAIKLRAVLYSPAKGK